MNQGALSLDALDTLFPFWFAVDPSLHVVRCGPSLARLYPCVGDAAPARFALQRPAIPWAWEPLCKLAGRLVVVGCFDLFRLHVTPILVEGPQPLIAFCGSPWLDHAEDILKFGMTIKYFAPQDLIVSYLFMLQRLESESKSKQEALARDLAAQAELEHLKIVQREREHLAQLKDQFIANISHELRTPLTGILGAAEAIGEGAFGPVSEELEYPVEVIVRSATHLLAVVNDLLDMSKFAAEDVPIEPVPLSLNTLVQDCLDAVRPQLERRALALDMDPAACDDLLVLCDPQAGRRMIMHLLGNAIKYTDAGFIRVRFMRQAQLAHLTIEDSGCGIPSERLQHIFEPFRNEDVHTRRRRDGAGLGLAIARRLARQHGGDITATSQLGQGSLFTLSLPCAP